MTGPPDGSLPDPGTPHPHQGTNVHNKDLTSSIGLLILGVGGYMLTHGVGKVQMLLEGDLEQWQDPIGVGALPSLVLATGAEFLCALLVVLGLATRVAAVPVVVTMGVAAFVVHAGDPWTMQRAYELFAQEKAESLASREPALLYLFPFLALVLLGGGRFSLDHVLWGRKKPRPER